MLLDRKKIRRWAKWIALILAIIFAISFVAIGVGTSSGNNVLAAFSCSNSKSAATDQNKTADQQIAAYQQTLQTDPTNKDALIGLANVYQQVYDASQNTSNSALLLEEAKYLEQYIAADPAQIDVYLRLAKLYMSTPVSDNQAAVDVLNKAVNQAPDNADVFLQLGVAQRALGNKSAAVMAWQRYLELAPNGDMAQVVKDGIKQLSETTTTTAASPTTTGGTGSTNAAATTTTTAASTSTSQ